MNNRYVVVMTINGSVKTICVRANDESDAISIAQSEMLWGGRIESVRRIEY